MNASLFTLLILCLWFLLSFNYFSWFLISQLLIDLLSFSIHLLVLLVYLLMWCLCLESNMWLLSLALLQNALQSLQVHIARLIEFGSHVVPLIFSVLELNGLQAVLKVSQAASGPFSEHLFILKIALLHMNPQLLKCMFMSLRISKWLLRILFFILNHRL